MKAFGAMAAVAPKSTMLLATMLVTSAWILGILVAAFFVQVAHFLLVMQWGDRRTMALGYYGQLRKKRRRFKSILRWHALILAPTLAVLARIGRFTFQSATFHEQGVAGPKGTCTPESFRRAAQYPPRPEDVFIATQMKCGTTWMQQLVLQLVTRGETDLAQTGEALYGMSPWLESVKGVRVESAPLLGSERPARIIKTHFPASHCPYDTAARYIYVVRHPVSCFASCVDFVRDNLGRFTPPLEEFERWFCCDDLMWWGPWPSHVAGWWKHSRDRENVLFVRFEDMKRDLGRVAADVAEFLGISNLAPNEMTRVLENCSFEYMQTNADVFEMHPPHILQTAGRFFVSGAVDRYRDIPGDVQQRILTWSQTELAGSGLTLAEIYPDAAVGGMAK